MAKNDNGCDNNDDDDDDDDDNNDDNNDDDDDDDVDDDDDDDDDDDVENKNNNYIMICMLRVLIGSSDCVFCDWPELLLVLVLLHSVENCSYSYSSSATVIVMT